MSQFSTAPKFDPTALLQRRNATKQEEKVPANASEQTDDKLTFVDNDEDFKGMGAYLENHHRVEVRDGRPVKRQKVEAKDEDYEDSDSSIPKKKMDSKVMVSNGDMGAYLKEERKKLNDKPFGDKPMVDLTSGEKQN